MLKRPIIILFFIFQFTVVFSQQESPWAFAMGYRYGFIFPHRSSIAYLIQHHITAIDITVSKQLANHEKWEKWYRYPNVGGGLYWANLGNANYLGNVFAAYGFMDIPFTWKTKGVRFSYSIASGLAYLTRHFDVKDNYYNIAIGSSLNAYADFGLMVHHSFQYMDIAAGICYTHYSNGAWSKPNLGLNVPSVKLNASFLTKPFIPSPSIKDTLSHKNYFISIMLAGGIRQNSQPDQRHFFASTLAVNLEKELSVRRKVGIGLDVFYDPSIPPRMAEYAEVTPSSPYVRMGLRLSHDLIFNHFSITMQAGSYFYDPDLPDGYIYSRVGLRYKINARLEFDLLLKTHFVKADLVEFGVSFFPYSFQRK